MKSPRCAVGDGALGFWGALQEVYPDTKQQRCWVHKTANVLDKLPKSQHSKAKSMIHDIYMAANIADALTAWDEFIEQYEVKYPKAIQCLEKDKDQMFTFYGFPAEHWVHLRTTNPIESTFATVRHRTKKSKNCFSRKTIMASVYKLCREAEKRWRFLNGKKRLAQVINFEIFIDGIHEKEVSKQEQIHTTVAA
jgi:transposase-like protein